MNTLLIKTLFLFIQLILPPDEKPNDKEIITKLASYSWNHPQEKVYLHTDKDFYVAGEDIWFKAYLMVGPYHIPDTLSSVLYVELIHNDGTIIDRRNIHMLEGLGFGDFDLPFTIIPGEYILKAYTRYMQNYDPAFHFRKRIYILPSFQKDPPGKKTMKANKLQSISSSDYKPIQIQFFPEGGNMAVGLQNYIAFKATDHQGKGKDVKGVIINSQGHEVTKFKSQKFGVGIFAFKHEKEEEYIARISYDSLEFQYELPEPIQKGYAMHIKQTGDNVFIWVRNNMGINMNNSFVIGQFRGFPFITVHAESDHNYLYSILNTKEIPSGIIQFTFFDSLGVPQCERLVYTESEKDKINFSIGSDKKIYKKRELALIDIHSEDLMGNPTLTNLSLSITNTAIVSKDYKKSNIRSYFNLESDLKGHIENPGYYFNPDNEDRYELLDILMLTQGWRRFVWKEILDDQYPILKFPVEAGFNIEGWLADYYNQSIIKPGHVRLFIYENQIYYNELETDENGSFQFQGIDIYDSTHIVMQAWRPSKNPRKPKKNKPPEKKNDFSIKINDTPFAVITPKYWPGFAKKEEPYKNYLDLNDFILKIDSSFEGRTIVLDELMIKDKIIASENSFERPGKLHKNPTKRIVMDSLSDGYFAVSLFDIIRQKFPSVRVRGAPPNLQIVIRGPTSIHGDNTPLILLDGIEVDSDFIYYFPSSEIAFIDVLSSAQAAIYGREAANGVIAFYTRLAPKQFQKEGRMGLINFVHPGYYRAREFYAPDYNLQDEKHVKPDYRRILYWNPSITTDDQGDHTFSFYTSDETAEYRVEIEGMTYSGIPFTYEYFFSVE